MTNRPAAIRLTAFLVGAMAVSAGCAAASGSPQVVTVRGGIFTVFHSDATCAEQVAPPEITGVVLTFHAPAGEALGAARTGEPQGQDLPPGPGKLGWRAFGCSFLAPYVVELPPAEGYEVRFTPTAFDADSSFQGVEELEPEVISMTDLEAAEFWWAFEAAPSYVVP